MSEMPQRLKRGLWTRPARFAILLMISGGLLIAAGAGLMNHGYLSALIPGPGGGWFWPGSPPASPDLSTPQAWELSTSHPADDSPAHGDRRSTSLLGFLGMVGWNTAGIVVVCAAGVLGWRLINHDER